MANIQLTQELVKSLFDYKDGFLYWKVRPLRSSVKIGDKTGYLNHKNTGSRYVISVSGKQCLQSRIIFLWHHGYIPEFVDHVNRVTFDDRIENLRAAKRSENNSNRISNRGVSIYKGVCFKKCRYHYKWVATIICDKKRYYLGSFDNEVDAATAYNKASLKLHGEFSQINIIQP